MGRVDGIWGAEPGAFRSTDPLPTTSGQVLRAMLGAQRQAVLAGALCGIGWMGSLAAAPVVLGAVINQALSGGAASLAAWLGVLAVVGGAQVATESARHWMSTRLLAGTKLAVVELVTHRVLDPRGSTRATAPGELVSRATADATRLGGIADLCCRGAGAVVTFAVVAVGMLIFQPLLGLVILAGLVPMLALLGPMWRPLERRARAEQARIADASAVAADFVAGLRILKGLRAEPVAVATFQGRTEAVRQSALRVARLDGGFEVVEVLIPGLFLALVTAVGGHLALDGELTIGELVAYLGLAQFLRIPLGTFAELGSVWSQGLAAAGRIAGQLAEPVAVEDGPDVTPCGMDLKLVDVHLDGVLRGLNLELRSGETVGFVAADPRVPAAMSTLLARVRDPDAGIVLLGGVELRAMALTDLFATMLVAEYDPFLFAATLAQNVAVDRMFGPVHLEAARTAAVAEITERLPDGWDTDLEERGRTLSGGQRQRVGLARVLAADTPILVLLDPTSAVDAHTEAMIVSAALPRGMNRTTLLITTSPALLVATNRVVYIEDGRVAGSGRHPDLLAASPGYRDAVDLGGTPT